MMSFISFPIPYTSAAILWATSLLWAVFGVNTIDFGIHVYCAVGTTIAFFALNGIVALNLEELGLKPQPKTKKKAKKKDVSEFQQKLAEHREQTTVRTRRDNRPVGCDYSTGELQRH